MITFFYSGTNIDVNINKSNETTRQIRLNTEAGKLRPQRAKQGAVRIKIKNENILKAVKEVLPFVKSGLIFVILKTKFYKCTCRNSAAHNWY